jgi:hypothetical protein
MHSPRTRRLAAAALTLALTGAALGACGDDDDAEASDTTAADGFASGTSLSPAACDAYAEAAAGMVGDPAALGGAIEALAGALPEDLADAGADLAGAAASGEEALGSPEFTAAWATVGDAAYEGCDADAHLDVRGVDYGFEGLPATVDAGRVAVRFTNGTTSGEMHELVLLKRNEGTTETVDELMALGQEQVMEKVTMTGVAFADAADAESVLLADLEPGGYIAICMIPVGSGETGDPHAAHGMVAEIEVA